MPIKVKELKVQGYGRQDRTEELLKFMKEGELYSRDEICKCLGYKASVSPSSHQFFGEHDIEKFRVRLRLEGSSRHVFFYGTKKTISRVRKSISRDASLTGEI